MIGFNLFKASPFVLEKMNCLCRLLWQSKRKYEKAAENIPDKELRCTILTLAQGKNQYACELSSQIHTLGGIPPHENIDDAEQKEELTILRDEKEVLAFCKVSESGVVNAYREILDEASLYEGLRKMIHYQLNGALCAFMQLKLLSSLKFHLPIFEHNYLADAKV